MRLFAADEKYDGEKSDYRFRHNAKNISQMCGSQSVERNDSVLSKRHQMLIHALTELS
jgi:hypothetical protein